MSPNSATQAASNGPSTRADDVPLLRVRDLHVSYTGALRALHGVSLDVPGEGVVAVLGANGAGKSTLLRGISGTLHFAGGRAVAGSVEFDGRRLDGMDPAAIARAGVVPRISADPAAVGYMIRHISFSGRLSRPMLTIHTIGDPLVPVQVQDAYADAVADSHRSALLRQAYVRRGGHCTFTTGEMLAALKVLERRISTGRWPDTSPEALNRIAGPGAAYTSYQPAPYPRPFNLGR